MTPADLARFLAAVRVIDDRLLINEATMLAWSELLPDWLDLDLALAALREHYQTSDKRVMPAHIINLAKPHRPELPAPPRIDCETCNGHGLFVSIGEDDYRHSYYCQCIAGQWLRKSHGR